MIFKDNGDYVMSNTFLDLAQHVGELLQARHLTLATAESCTGGQIAEVITTVPGSSNWFERGFVTYSNIAKREMLGVKAETLELYGAVSEQIAREMAEGALKRSHADLSIAVTGIAGPDGGTTDKPVGTVWFGWARKGFETLVQLRNFSGDRLAVRDQTVEFALREMIKSMQS